MRAERTHLPRVASPQHGATALGRSEGLTRFIPSIVFAAARLAGFAGLAYAMQTLPVGTAYAVWVGMGAALTAGYAMWTGTEPTSPVRVLLLAGSSAACSASR